MVSIYVCGQDKTRQISDWEIQWNRKQGELTLTCHYPSKKIFSRPLSDCEVIPTRELNDKLFRKRGSLVFSAVEKAVIYGEKYAVVQYPGSTGHYLFKMDSIEFVSPTTIKDESAFGYFRSVATARINNASSKEQKVIAENVLRQLQAIPSRADTALHAYCAGQNGRQDQPRSFIFPFGLNESQLQATEQAFNSQISMIEGPPGTGKTQTILNIIANVLLQGKTVAVVSNNNSAVKNVYEKLGKCGLDYLVAKLGSKEHREEFFANRSSRPSADPEPVPTMESIQAVLQQLKLCLGARNAVAQLQIEIDELDIERRYLLQWQKDSGVVVPALDRYKLSPQKTTDLMAYLAQLADERIRIKDRIELLFNFRILRTKPLDDWDKRKSVFYGLQLHYYDEALLEKKTALAVYQEELRLGNFKVLLEELTSSSMRYLKYHLHLHISNNDTFDAKTYRGQLDAFVKRYPIIGSSTHSIINSLGPGAVLDYVIIDEASQQDTVPGVLALGCAKNLIIVGDRKQLAHIPVSLGMAAPAPYYDCEKYSLLDSCVGVFRDSIPMTLLKEHYRCHPRIIQFCNQQFYDNQLVPMTQDDGEQALTLLVTAKGNHTRQNTNLRELDSLLAVLEGEGESAWEGEDGRGFIAPFRAQSTLSSAHLPADFVNDTVHKFQGRECDEIVFSTVLDKHKSLARLDFVDDPRMVNVAVSRAKNRFTLVTGDDVFKASNGHIAALIRYIEYYADDRQVHRAPVISAFDLLYKEYDRSLARLNARLRPNDSSFKSEQIVAQILRETLTQDACRAIMFHAQIKLIQLVSVANEVLTARELEFMKNNASCDFVLYFKVGKKPLGVIEVDGGSHDEPEQAERDALKNSILQKSDIPLLRLRTVESHVEEKLAGFLAQWTNSVLP
ncbi:AAA domain-containing protein [Pseudomonas sp.]|uniref:AAA domain-containing protein n=1 Tax=Pseudomonas sp. TaxID=306 RepID=UPI0026271778|nr:AAA domain-containing protein [Pseudomonas sp.]